MALNTYFLLGILSPLASFFVSYILHLCRIHHLGCAPSFVTLGAHNFLILELPVLFCQIPAVLGYPIQDYQHNITLRKYQMRLHVNISPIFITTLNFELYIINHHCAPNNQQDNLIAFILARNSINYLS